MKRILAIIASALCLAVSILPLVPSSRNDVTASALTYEEVVDDKLYSIPLPTYNSIYNFDFGHVPLPLTAVISRDSFALCRSVDGISADMSNVIWFTPLGVTQGEYTVDLPFILRDYGENTLSCKVATYVSSFGFRDMTSEVYADYVPYKVTGYYIFPTVDGNVATPDYMYIDYYVDYSNVYTGDIIRGAGFSIRIPYHAYWDEEGPYSFGSAFYNAFEVDELPRGNFKVYESTSVYGMTYGQSWSYYFQGKVDGYQEGISDKDDYWYNQGYNKGYDRGYIEGVDEHQNYTFNGLISAVIDVPLNALRSVLNFNILGVDMATFFFSLATLAVVLAVVRLFM